MREILISVLKAICFWNWPVRHGKAAVSPHQHNEETLNGALPCHNLSSNVLYPWTMALFPSPYLQQRAQPYVKSLARVGLKLLPPVAVGSLRQDPPRHSSEELQTPKCNRLSVTYHQQAIEVKLELEQLQGENALLTRSLGDSFLSCLGARFANVVCCCVPIHSVRYV